jgi:hypothetical protein
MPDWNTRLEVTVNGQRITPIQSFNPTFTTPFTVVHSLEADNQGFIRQPFTFTFIMVVKAIGTVVADLTDLALQGTPFDVAIAEKQGTDWSLKSIKFANCVSTSSTPSNTTLTDAPTATFNCAALTVNIEKGS